MFLSHALLLFLLMKVKRFWLMMTRILQSFQKIVFLTNLSFLLSLYTLKTLKISKLNQFLSMRHYFLIIFVSKGSWPCKICTSFSQSHSGSRAFTDKPGNLDEHPTERFTDHLKSNKHFSSGKTNNVTTKCQSVMLMFWQLATSVIIANASDA